MQANMQAALQMFSKPHSPSTKKVVIVGGGLGGSLVAHQLEDFADVTLIDPKEHMEIVWAKLRPIVEPKMGPKILIPHEEYLKKGKIVQAMASEITTTEVVTSTGESVPYDFLVIATGHKAHPPFTISEVKEVFEDENRKVIDSEKILIIGGGPVAVELAAEIVSDYPMKKVTMVQAGPRLLDFLAPPASNKALKFLTSKNVDVILNDRVSINEYVLEGGPKTYTTTSGKEIFADAVFVCTGPGKPDTSYLKGAYHELVDPKGHVKVDQFLRLEGQKNVFAVGDVTNVKELKQGYLAQQHAGVVVANIKKLLKNPEETRLSQYKPGPTFAIVSLGRNYGVMQTPLMTFGGLLPTQFKSKGLFISQVYSNLGVKADFYVKN